MLSRAIVTAGAFIAVLMSAASSSTYAVPTSVGPNLVTNGGFEATSVIAGSGWTPSGFFGEGIDFFIDPNVAHAHGGSRSFASGALGSLGFISQLIPTIPGRNYNIELWLANISGFAEGTEIQVLWNGSVVYDQMDILGFGYNRIFIDPPATSATTTLSIGLRDDSFFLNVDDIAVRLAAAVPEPGTLALLAFGFVALALPRRKLLTTSNM